jgi:hypothetical protein
MLVSIDIVFFGPQIRIPYIMIVEAPCTVGDRWSMAWMSAYIAVPNLLSMISMVCIRLLRGVMSAGNPEPNYVD